MSNTELLNAFQGWEYDALIAAGISQVGPVFKFALSKQTNDTKRFARAVLSRLKSETFKAAFSLDAPAQNIDSSIATRKKSTVTQFKKPKIIKKKFASDKAMKFTVPEFSFQISRNKIFIDESSLHSEIHQNIYEELSKFTSFTCMVAFKKTIANKSLITFYGTCRFPGCRKFKFLVTRLGEESCNIDVYPHGEVNSESHSKFTIRRQHRGTRRLQQVKVSLFQSATLHRNKMILEKDMSRANYGNIDYVSELPAIRKFRSDGLACADLDSDDVMDLASLRQIAKDAAPTDNDRTPDYIRDIGMVPFSVFWFCQSQIKALFSESKRNAYFDATGSVVRKSKCFLISI